MGKRRTKLETEKLRKEIADLYLRGIEQIEIGEIFGITQQNVSHHLKKTRKIWLTESIRDFDEAKAEELVKIDLLEREYWLGWQRSQEDKEIKITEMVEGEDKGKKRAKIMERKEGKTGSPRFLEGIIKCIERRCKLLGFDEAKKINQDITTGGRPIRIKEIIMEIDGGEGDN